MYVLSKEEQITAKTFLRVISLLATERRDFIVNQTFDATSATSEEAYIYLEHSLTHKPNEVPPPQTYRIEVDHVYDVSTVVVHERAEKEEEHIRLVIGKESINADAPADVILHVLNNIAWHAMPGSKEQYNDTE